jgi:hypothetical protein
MKHYCFLFLTLRLYGLANEEESSDSLNKYNIKQATVAKFIELIGYAPEF